MRESDMLRALALRCREDQTAALFVVGFFAASATHEVLEDLLRALEELRVDRYGRDHLAAYYERWGRYPAGVDPTL